MMHGDEGLMTNKQNQGRGAEKGQLAETLRQRDKIFPKLKSRMRFQSLMVLVICRNYFVQAVVCNDSNFMELTEKRNFFLYKKGN